MDGAWPANDNAPGQVVIAGTASGVEAAGEAAKALGAKRVIPLPVGGAFHSPLMGLARVALEEALAATDLVPGSVDVVANVDAEPKRDALFWHYPHYSNQGVQPSSAVRLGDMKMIEFLETGRRELFDLKSDRSESRNLSADRPEVVKQLADRLDAWKMEVGAQGMKPNPNFVPNPQAADGTITLAARSAEVRPIIA